ncbi:5'-nucleotidase [Xylona heveae TC161]|uniref:5'-nucleotidase n=1 Tax=Xylona heveae (strain CBS 132557 / TC161) TaxID=1328760 RepID=A0A165INB1_XYLHT|nr:5'-nucleotidase [Xylona heveae TC161]KZF25145.1 5'-nucleotidase [Xylona heveae TC161]
MAPPGTSITFSSGRNDPPDLRLLHYNDVYHVEAGSQDPVGGIARFQTLINEYNSPQYDSQPKLLTFFSGDAFNPSIESTISKGAHMIDFLNGTGIDVACLGNHDLDFGVTQFRYLAGRCTFPWLIANVLDPDLAEENAALGNCQKTLILTSSNGIKVGVIGLVEREWLETINSLPPNLIYKSASATAEELVPGLRAQGAEIIIAVTHMREPNDLKLAEKTTPGLIDIIMGGHDHFYGHHFVNKTHVLRSGTDFRQLSYIEARKKQDGSHGWDFDITRRDVLREVAEDPVTLQAIERLETSLKAKLEKPIGYSAVPLDARFETARLKESNLGNFVCDLMRHYYNADCALMAGGTIRGDQIYSPGIIHLKDIMNCFPFEDPVIVLRVTGRAILEALENSVSKYPALEGRFSQVSSIQFKFNPKAPSGSRILWARIGDGPLDLERKYVLCTRGYMGRGKDGFQSLLVESEGGQAEELVSEEQGVMISTILRQYFMSLKVIGKWRRMGPHIRMHLTNIHERMCESGYFKEPDSQAPVGQTTTDTDDPQAPKPAVEEKPAELDYDTDDETMTVGRASPGTHHRERRCTVARMVTRKWMRLAGVKRENVGMVWDDEGEFMPSWTTGIRPRLEGRIIMEQTVQA